MAINEPYLYYGICGCCGCPVRAAIVVAVPACLVHPAHRYGVSGFAVGAGARGCVLCWGAAGGALPVVVCCVSCFVHMDCYRRCACSVVANLCCDFLFATPDASCALCPVLPCAAQLDVSNPLTRVAQQHHPGNLSQHRYKLFQRPSYCSVLLLQIAVGRRGLSCATLHRLWVCRPWQAS